MLPQPESQDVLSPLTEAAIILVLSAPPGGEEAVRGFLADLSGLTRSVGFRVPEAELTCVVGIGSELWDRLFGPPRPKGLHPFREIRGSRHTAVSTPGDLLVHLRAHRLDLCFELAQHVTERLGSAATVVDEIHGFRSFDDRDLLGFVDGTENPSGAAARVAGIIGKDDPAFAGGSYVVVQKYVHDLTTWDALPVEDQELAVGRTKLNDLELSDEAKPSNSHVALNTIVDESGVEHQILRYNMPFGRVGTREFGTYFIGYTASVEVIEEMLTNMFVGKPPGNYDRLLDFSTAVTGCLFFVPDAAFVDDPPPGAPGSVFEPAEDVTPAPDPPLPDDHSLGIGSLRGALS
jgi:putative iron-dependent peroxidase